MQIINLNDINKFLFTLLKVCSNIQGMDLLSMSSNKTNIVVVLSSCTSVNLLIPRYQSPQKQQVY